jgi:hypothetical protein
MKGLEIFSEQFRFLKEGMLECPPLDRPIAREVGICKLDRLKRPSKTG